MTDLNVVDVGRLLQIEAKVMEWIDIGHELDVIDDDPHLSFADKANASDELWEKREKIYAELKSMTGRA
jgi:hypothetical protein